LLGYRLVHREYLYGNGRDAKGFKVPAVHAAALTFVLHAGLRDL
jgi:hypothetical protein